MVGLGLLVEGYSSGGQALRGEDESPQGPLWTPDLPNTPMDLASSP